MRKWEKHTVCCIYLRKMKRVRCTNNNRKKRREGPEARRVVLPRGVTPHNRSKAGQVSSVNSLGAGGKVDLTAALADERLDVDVARDVAVLEHHVRVEGQQVTLEPEAGDLDVVVAHNVVDDLRGVERGGDLEVGEVDVARALDVDHLHVVAALDVELVEVGGRDLRDAEVAVLAWSVLGEVVAHALEVAGGGDEVEAGHVLDGLASGHPGVGGAKSFWRSEGSFMLLS